MTMANSRRRISFLFMIFVPITGMAATIETVPVGNPGNPNESPFGSHGDVSYEYRIGKYEVSNAQYTEFLNSVDPSGTNRLGLHKATRFSFDAPNGIDFDPSAPDAAKYLSKPGRSSNPVSHVSWFDGIRFANWLHNGQGSGSTETGAYTIPGGQAFPPNQEDIVRNPGAIWFLPTEDEWFKAAYHKNDGVTGNYWNYPTSSDTIPYSDEPPGTDSPDPANTANFTSHDGLPNGYNDGFAVTGSTRLDSSQNYLTDVGAYTEATSPYGTYDQGGNVAEWLEDGWDGNAFRGVRGGDYFIDRMSKLVDRSDSPDEFGSGTGFRVASVFDLPAGPGVTPGPDVTPDPGVTPSVEGDCNGDGVVDASDANCANPDFVGDCSGDGMLNIFDANCTLDRNLDILLNGLGVFRGDFDGNGRVQFQDFLIIADNFGKPGQYTDGDFDKSGAIQFADFLAFADAFGGDSGEREASVPEPGTPALAWPAAIAILLVRRHRNSLAN